MSYKPLSLFDTNLNSNNPLGSNPLSPSSSSTYSRFVPLNPFVADLRFHIAHETLADALFPDKSRPDALFMGGNVYSLINICSRKVVVTGPEGGFAAAPVYEIEESNL